MNAIIILSLLLKVAVSIPDADNQLHIYALPVGQGDCTVIQCPKANGGPTKGVVTIDIGSLLILIVVTIVVATININSGSLLILIVVTIDI